MPSIVTDVVEAVVVVVVMIDTKSIAMVVAVVIVGATVIDRKAVIPAKVEARLAKNDRTHTGTLVATNDFTDAVLRTILLFRPLFPPLMFTFLSSFSSLCLLLLPARIWLFVMAKVRHSGRARRMGGLLD